MADGVSILVHNDAGPLGTQTDDECTYIKDPITVRAHLQSITDALGEWESTGDHLATRGPGAGSLSTTVGKLPPESPGKTPNSSGAGDILVGATMLPRAAVPGGKYIAKRWRGTTG
ncbi:hypothetical protein [Kitasatospora sp. LaBMicrA B282]|uniref:hypothetical protein n=1 Tax=Kitasatospora sp. LaBMicrA B282 TaxID=3420949 RepID=UPI003D1365BC